MEKELLTVADVALALGVTTGRVYQLIGAGEIPNCRIGRAIKIPRRAWEAWVTEQNQRAQANLREGAG